MKAKPVMTGYEKVADLMTAHAEMAMFQRFDFLNTLNALYLQAELVHLERKMKGYLRNGFESAESTAVYESQNDVGSEIAFQEQQDVEASNNTNTGEADAAENTDIPPEVGMSMKGRNDASDNAGATAISDPEVEATTSVTPIPEPQINAGNSSETSSMTSIPDPVRDWWDLANAEESSEAANAWETMLKVREKLKEYSRVSHGETWFLF